MALHFAHAAALDGYRVLVVDFDPQATLSHSMGLSDVGEDHTVWGHHGPRSGTRDRPDERGLGRGGIGHRPAPSESCVTRSATWALARFAPAISSSRLPGPTIDIVPSCANAAFVEFASAQYRHLNPEWTFFGAVSRFLDSSRADDAYDLILFDCPPPSATRSMNAVFAADMLYIPRAPGY